jgi:hypothetical protein
MVADNLQKSEGGPFIVKICIRQAAPEHPDVARLTDFARHQPFFCIVEVRGIARAAATVEGGAGIDATLPGTLGGFLRDQKGDVYGVTCGHVAQIAAQTYDVTDVNGALLRGAGTVAHTSFGSLTPLLHYQHCNRQQVDALEEKYGRTAGTTVDAALLNLSPPHLAGPAVGRIGDVDQIFNSSQFGSSSAVELYGNVCKHIRGYVGGYAVVYKVLFHNGDFHCFDHMFEVKTRSRFSSLLPPALAAKPVSGDSGAWVCIPNSAGNGKFALCGMLIAVDGMDSYACFAETILHWADKNYGLSLQPI